MLNHYTFSKCLFLNFKTKNNSRQLHSIGTSFLFCKNHHQKITYYIFSFIHFYDVYLLYITYNKNKRYRRTQKSVIHIYIPYYIVFRRKSTIFPDHHLALMIGKSLRGQRKGYRVLYAFVVRFIVRSRFVRSFVYCIYTYTTTPRAFCV